MPKVLKRLEIIKQLVDLEEYEDIAKHRSKLETYHLPTSVTEILIDLQQKKYEKIIAAIQQYQQRSTSLTTYKDPEIERLKISIKVLEIEIAAIDNEIQEAEKLIHDFGIHHHQELGDVDSLFYTT